MSPENQLEVVEYWPGFVDRDDEPRRAIVSNESEIAEIPWLKEKGKLFVDRDYVKLVRCGWVVAIIHRK